MKKGIIYDFDKTIYKNETSTKFLMYYLKKHPQKIFKFITSLIAISVNFRNLKKTKELFFRILRDDKNISKDIASFWEEEIRNNNFFSYFDEEIKKNKKEADTLILISASPDFLLNVIYKQLGFDILICTKYDKNYRIIGKNCKGIEKVNRLKEIGEFDVLAFYSDSMSDKPLYDIAKKHFFIDKKGILKQGMPSKNGIIDKWV